SRAEPTRPVAPVSKITLWTAFQIYVANRSYLPSMSNSQQYAARPLPWGGRAVNFLPGTKGSDRTPMTYVIAEPCIGTKDNSCVEVCPVDCIHPTPDEPDYDSVEMLHIDPDECIDCDACVEACPVDACFAEDQLPSEWQSYTKRNADYFA